MKLAIESVQKKEMSIRKASLTFMVPKDSLQRRISGKLKSIPADQLHKKLLSSKTKVLSDKQEEELAIYIKEMDQMFYGLSINDIRHLVFEYAEQRGIENPFNKAKKMAGRDFVESFLKRNASLSLRKPEGVSLNRVFGLNKKSVEQYFSNLKLLIDDHNFQPHQIYNCDETGLTCVHKPIKVIAPKGKRVVASITSGEKGQTTTIINAMSVTGHFIPPMMIFKRKRLNPDLIERAPPGTTAGCSDSGWIDKDLFMKYIKHFINHSKCSLDSKILLILDGHKSHTKNIELIEYARANGLHMLSLPPHTSHKLQPLDRSFFKGLKAAYNVACTQWLRNHPGRRITVDRIGELFSVAYMKAATVEIAASGFSTTGIHPFNPDVIPSADFVEAPSESTPHCLEAQSSQQSMPDGVTETCSEAPAKSAEAQPGPSSSNVEAGGNQKGKNQEEISFSIVPPSPRKPNGSADTSTPDASDISFMDIMPLPKWQGSKGKKRRRKEESQIITSSPYKRKLELELVPGRAKQGLKNKGKKGSQAKEKGKVKTVHRNKKKGHMKSKRKQQIESTEDCQCMVCFGWWHETLPGDEWIKCSKCALWFHEVCCSSLPTADFKCDFCI